HSHTLLNNHLPSSRCFSYCYSHSRHLHSFPTRRSSDLVRLALTDGTDLKVWKRGYHAKMIQPPAPTPITCASPAASSWKICWKRSEEHTSELQSLRHLVCRLLLEKKKTKKNVLNIVIDE